MAVSYKSGSMKLFQFVFFSPAPFRGSVCDYGKYNKFHNYFVLSSSLQIKALDGINPLHQLALKLPPFTILHVLSNISCIDTIQGR